MAFRNRAIACVWLALLEGSHAQASSSHHDGVHPAACWPCTHLTSVACASTAEGGCDPRGRLAPSRAFSAVDTIEPYTHSSTRPHWCGSSPGRAQQMQTSSVGQDVHGHHQWLDLLNLVHISFCTASLSTVQLAELLHSVQNN